MGDKLRLQKLAFSQVFPEIWVYEKVPPSTPWELLKISPPTPPSSK